MNDDLTNTSRLELHKSAVVSIIGKPNVGKSTLLNRIIGQKISIVTPKAQTTRNIINGITNICDTQLVFLDTPGIFEAKRSVDKSIVRHAWYSINGADFVIVMLDAISGINDSILQILKRVISHKLKLIIAINKVDAKNNKLVDILKHFISEDLKNTPIFQISALNGNGVQQLLDYLVNNAKTHPWQYDNEYITTLPMRFLAAEITREQLFLKLRQELPYNLTVHNEKWENFDDGSVKIHQVINVATSAHKKIILGKNGSMIKSVGSEARSQLEQIYGIKAHLFLFVKVKADFLNDPNAFDRLE